MAVPRLSFLYPQALKATRGWEPPSNFAALQRARDRRVPLAPRTHRRHNNTFHQQRYGQAAEPMPAAKPGEVKPSDGEAKKASPAGGASNASTKPLKATPVTEGEAAAAAKPRTDVDTQPEVLPHASAASAGTSEPPPTAAGDAATSPSLSLAVQESSAADNVLQLGADSEQERRRHPHLEPPPYVHHFDTYTLVRQLGEGGFTQAQSVTMMKAVRSLLAANMELAQAGLVGKSDVENSSYLFRAAVSELRTEVQNGRAAAARARRSDLAHLQHDTETLAQRMTQELNTLRDDLKGLFDDRKMTVRTELRRADAAVEQINRRILVNMQSDGKGKIEGLRWALAKRAVMAIVATAAIGLLFLRYFTAARHRKDREQDPKPKTEPLDEAAPRSDSDALLASVKDGKDGPGYVSLG